MPNPQTLKVEPGATDGTPMQGAPGAPAAVSGGGDAAVAVPGPTARVLYVDDEASLCRAFARLFRDEPRVTVETVGAPIQAVELIRGAVGQARPIDVVVSDLRMPGMTGIEVLAVARQALPAARRLLVSGYADFQTALEAINEVGVDRLLTKPWENEEVRGAVRAAAEHAFLQRENARVTEELRRRTDELSRMNQRLDGLVEERTRDLLDALVSALDLRDSESQWHSRRVGRYARRLGRELGLDGRELDDVERGATLHDIGKIGVRDAVLLKPGPLSPAEWKEMRRHPALGHEILKGIGFLERARLIPLQHQERWDGSGYPRGLKGTQICVGARIFAAVDTYDALTSDRPYRKCSTYEAARAEIVKVSGTQLDPDVVTAWLRIPQAEWDAIREQLEGATPKK
jgi:response regulator RpfG family c-di-GMP phosphodiesterase